MSHTPKAHKQHTKPCCCAVTKEEAFQVCKCGARYSAEILMFLKFICYDCGREYYSQELQ